MKFILYAGILLILFSLGIQSSSAGSGAGTIGIGDQVNLGTDYFHVYSNVEGAQVFFTDTSLNEIYEGVISKGSLSVTTPSNTMRSFRVTANGYLPFQGQIYSQSPTGGEINLFATLTPILPPATTTVQTTTPPPTQSPAPTITKTQTKTPTKALTPVNGSTGYYLVHSDVDYAKVYFIDANGEESYMGLTNRGELRILFYLTTTPYTSYRVEAAGYPTLTDTIDSAPSKGKTVDLIAKFKSVTTTKKPTSTKKPVSTLTTPKKQTTTPTQKL